MKEILYVLPFANGFVAHCISDAGAKTQVYLHEVRGACIKPTDGQPGYYAYYGIVAETNPYGKNPLLFLCEGAVSTPGALIKKVFEDAPRMKAWIMYVDQGAQQAAEGFYRDMWRAASGTKLRIRPAVSPRDIEYGDALVNEWRFYDSIKLPMPPVPNIARTQLYDKMNTDTDVRDNSLYAFHCMRFLLAGLVHDPVKKRVVTGGFSGDEQLIKSKDLNQVSVGGWT